MCHLTLQSWPPWEAVLLLLQQSLCLKRTKGELWWPGGLELVLPSWVASTFPTKLRVQRWYRQQAWQKLLKVNGFAFPIWTVNRWKQAIPRLQCTPFLLQHPPQRTVVAVLGNHTWLLVDRPGRSRANARPSPPKSIPAHSSIKWKDFLQCSDHQDQTLSPIEGLMFNCHFVFQ